ncbi:MAG TPA: fumarylacetoacetate hydrolase family protein [Acidobacteriota bacterium]
MKLFRTTQGAIIEDAGHFYQLSSPDWDALINREDLAHFLDGERRRSTLLPEFSLDQSGLLAPIGKQEVWAAGVTYLRSRSARMDESRATGGDDFYDRVYNSERPELFFKATPHRVVGHGQKVKIRRDSDWNVPEPELTLLITSTNKIVGYTVGNDMSSREIEGENPLYLPQAKVYDRSCSLGPCILVSDEPLPGTTEIIMEIRRGAQKAFSDSTTFANMKRDPARLVDFLFCDNSFPNGCFLMTGTGIIPPDSFTLQPGDEIRITIEPIGTLVNWVG